MSERKLNFDKVVDRKGTKCLKYDFAVKRGYPEDVLPLWVADMDFKTSSYVEDAFSNIVSHNIYGYTNTQDGDGFFDAVAGWMKRHHNWEVRKEWHVKTPGVCFAIANAVRTVTNPGDAVMIQQPIYYPFSNIVRENGRKLVSNNLKYDGEGHYSIDFDDFEKKIVEHDVKMFILCNPHNPVGRVWTKEELERLGNICKEHHVIVFSDEIHFDFIWSGEHHVFQEIKEEFREFTITATSPSKTFNLAGVQQSNIFIPNKEIRDRFRKEYKISGLDEPNLFGIAAAQAAYRLIPTEGTYLIWLDFNDTGIEAKRLEELLVNKAKLWLDSGKIFGKTGEGFQRINVACARSVLKEALDRIRKCLEEG